MSWTEADMRRVLAERMREPDPGFAARITEALMEGGRPTRAAGPAWAAAAAVVLPVAAVGVLLSSQQHGVPAPVPAATAWAPAVPAPTETPKTVAAAPGVESIQFLSPNVGWAVRDGSVWGTRDAGASWTRSLDGFSQPLQNHMSWSDEQHGVLVDEQFVYRTDDGGVHWKQTPAPGRGNLVGISFIADREGWALYSGAAASQCQTQGFFVWHTADYGATWQELPLAGFTNGCKRSITFIDPKHGWIVSAASVSPDLLTTVDGGRSWTQSELPRDLLEPGAPYMTSMTSGIIASSSAVYSTHDGGRTWGGRVALPGPGAFEILDARNWWVTVGTRALRTADGGHTWSQVGTLPGTVSVMDFLSTSSGYAVVAGALYRTDDGGAHWTQVLA